MGFQTHPVHPRSWWTPHTPALAQLDPVEGIVVHHSASLNVPHTATPGFVAGFERMEMHHDPALSTIAYHPMIFPDGTIVECRPANRQGGATRSWNGRTIALLLLGWMGREGLPTAAQLEGAAQYVYTLSIFGHLKAGWWIDGHRWMPSNSTACPCIEQSVVKDIAVGAYFYGLGVTSTRPGAPVPTPSAPNGAPPNWDQLRKYVAAVLADEIAHWPTVNRQDRARVEKLQTALNLISPSYLLEPDGIWGGRTTNAVITFQRFAHLAADGIVGPKTRQALVFFLNLQAHP